jgi:hypothetical protein
MLIANSTKLVYREALSVYWRIFRNALKFNKDAPTAGLAEARSPAGAVGFDTAGAEGANHELRAGLSSTQRTGRHPGGRSIARPRTGASEKAPLPGLPFLPDVQRHPLPFMPKREIFRQVLLQAELQ